MRNRLLQLEQELIQANPKKQGRSPSQVASSLSRSDPLTAIERDLRDRPLDFLKKYSVLPSDGVMFQTGNLIQGGTKELEVQATVFDREQEIIISAPGPLQNQRMPNGEAIKRSTIERADKAIGLTRLDRESAGPIDLKLLAYSPANISNSKLEKYVPIWFLPWKPNHITELTILPPNLTAPCGLLNPHLFFTAALSGCSVFVQGSPTSPTIFHAGSDDRPPGNPGEYWKAIHQEISPRLTAQEVNKTQYYDANPHLASLTTRLQRGRGSNGHTMDDLRVSAVKGCVFGIRDDTTNHWSFYYQRNAKVEFWLYRDGQRRESTTRTRIVPMVTQFYPGATHVDVSNYPDFNVIL